MTNALSAVSLVFDTLQGHPYAAHVLDALSKLPSDVSLSSIRHYWVWGLGSLGNLGQAQLVRTQAAMALVLRDRLALAGTALAGPPETVDPVFTSLDTAVYGRLGFACQTGNHDWTVAEPTLLFAPHFEQVFATRLLRTTQAKGTLQNLVFIGNSISKCLERNHVRLSHTKEDVDFLEGLRTSGAMTEVLLPELGYATICPGAFNDLAVHFFVQ